MFRERVSHALGKAYRDVVRGFRGEFENPPKNTTFAEVTARPASDEVRGRTPAAGGDVHLL